MSPTGSELNTLTPDLRRAVFAALVDQRHRHEQASIDPLPACSTSSSVRVLCGLSAFRPDHEQALYPPLNAGDITVLLQQFDPDDGPAADQLLALVYDELRRLAAAKMARETPGQTLQPTALVHEAWLRLGGQQQPTWANRAHFFAAAAEAMRRILIENARRKRAVRHGGEFARVSADDTGFDLAAPTGENDDLLLLNEALDRLAAQDPRKAELVKHRYFVGLTIEEAADVLGISHRTAKRDWTYARAWLFNEVKHLRG